MAKILLTADRTLMSEYNKHVFLGFAACAPKFIPGWIYTKIFCPPVEEENGRAKYGHCGQRKIEAALLNSGFTEDDVAVIRPEIINDAITSDTKVLCITTHDPLGLGPASTTFSSLGGKEAYTSYYFRKLIENRAIWKNNLKVIVGGSGAWQLTDERIMAKLGIDSVVVGEGEITAVELVNKALNNEHLPSIVQGDVVPLEQIPLIRNPTLNGIIEICRGCGRGCRFCNPTMSNFRCIPMDRIMKEAQINVNAGNDVLLHAEDVLRYKAKGFEPNEEAVLKLFKNVKTLTPSIGISHFAHASVASKPSLVANISEIVEAGKSKHCPFVAGQVGIETGSSRLIEKYMKGKAKPFKPTEWNETVIQSHKILHDNHWVPCETMIFGLPGERKQDVEETIKLMHQLSGYKSLIVPLFFVPLGNLKGNGFFRIKDALPEHWRLLAITMRHNFKWGYRLAKTNFDSIGMNSLKIWAIIKVLKYLEKRAEPYIRLMEEGINPLEYEKNNKTPMIPPNIEDIQLGTLQT